LKAGRTKPWGTCHAVLCAAETVRSPFAVINSDDFYGARSFALVHDFLAAHPAGSRAWCMPGYQLRNTTSPHGHVSRGICAVGADGTLASIREHKKIIEQNGTFYSLETVRNGPEHVELPGDAIVSMNFWGLTPAFYDEARAEFEDFLKAHAADPSAECYLPEVVGSLIARGAGQVSVLETPEAWFGITYQEDLEAVRHHLRALTDSGLYPSPLWGS
ncbi:MAG: hypothetical protein N3A02_07370, partial [Rectinema sp.]|nr:hypothetical protein [Rectinema sp.]